MAKKNQETFYTVTWKFAFATLKASLWIVFNKVINSIIGKKTELVIKSV